ncbi:hypothetical protein [Streptomyces yangpuensis]|uniref:hypothetical protein n=1 Tax=Streptomyces yangpuensis TaxID=1648182 RepID=UPI0036C14993
MSTMPDPSAARRRYVTVCVLFWLPLGLTIAPLILLLTERGLTLAAIAGCFAAHSLTVVALELPTGGLSDALGRRGVLAAAGVANLAALTLVALGTAPWQLGLGMALMGAGRALSSGPAWPAAPPRSPPRSRAAPCWAAPCPGCSDSGRTSEPG